MPVVRLLLIEIGNSRAKFALAIGDDLPRRSRRSVPSRGLTAASVASAAKRFRFDHVVLCSVVPAAALAVRGALGARLALEINHSSPLPFSLGDYPRPRPPRRGSTG